MAAPPEEVDDADADAGDLALRFSVDARHAGIRLDKALAELMPDVSRSRLQQWVAGAAVRVNGATVRQRHELVLGDLIEIEPQPAPDAKAYAPEPMPLAIVHEDSDILVVDKPPGLVVHPAAGHWSGTLLNGLLAYSPQLADVPRAGIVHRDTKPANEIFARFLKRLDQRAAFVARELAVARRAIGRQRIERRVQSRPAQRS